jgi:hypothetical protein
MGGVKSLALLKSKGNSPPLYLLYMPSKWPSKFLQVLLCTCQENNPNTIHNIILCNNQKC